MISRCTYSGDTNYPFYGGRGICICKEWRDAFTQFREWALSHGYTDELSIDRIDPDGDYSPNNCRGVTMDIQANNKRNSIFVTINGTQKTVAEWSRILGINHSCIYSGAKRKGITVDDYITNRLKQRTVEDTGNGIDGQALDMFFESHQTALEFGVREVEVYVYSG